MAHAVGKKSFGKAGVNHSWLDRNGLGMRLAWSGGLLAIGLAAVAVGAQIGVVHVNAGDMKIVLGKSPSGFTMDIAARNCPPNCGFDINWRPLAR
jgi:hypothetical protein